jgi:hypothetical protein
MIRVLASVGLNSEYNLLAWAVSDFSVLLPWKLASASLPSRAADYRHPSGRITTGVVGAPNTADAWSAACPLTCRRGADTPVCGVETRLDALSRVSMLPPEARVSILAGFGKNEFKIWLRVRTRFRGIPGD